MYEKDNNTSNMEELTLVTAFNIGNSSSHTGTMSIKVTDTGYLISGSELPEDINIDVGGVPNPNTFGFFSDHYSHACSWIGYFKLSEVKVTVAPVD